MKNLKNPLQKCQLTEKCAYRENYNQNLDIKILLNH